MTLGNRYCMLYISRIREIEQKKVLPISTCAKGELKKRRVKTLCRCVCNESGAGGKLVEGVKNNIDQTFIALFLLAFNPSTSYSW